MVASDLTFQMGCTCVAWLLFLRWHLLNCQSVSLCNLSEVDELWYFCQEVLPWIVSAKFCVCFCLVSWHWALDIKTECRFVVLISFKPYNDTVLQYAEPTLFKEWCHIVRKCRNMSEMMECNYLIVDCAWCYKAFCSHLERLKGREIRGKVCQIYQNNQNFILTKIAFTFFITYSKLFNLKLIFSASI